MSDPVETILARLHASERRELRDLAAEAHVDVGDMVPAILKRYLQLRRDAPGAIPRDPIRGLKAGAQR
jgi:hypothetical protein